MPFLFVHGVANRRENPHNAEMDELKRTEQFRNITLHHIQGQPYQGHMRAPYWGDLGASLGWGGESVPRQLGGYEALGTQNPDDLDTTNELAQHYLAEVALTKVEGAFAEAVDIALAVAFEDAKVDDLAALDTFADQAAAYAAATPNPDWCTADMSNAEFLDELFEAVKYFSEHDAPADDPGTSGEFVALGGGPLGNLLTGLKNAAGRLIGVPRNGLARVTLGMGRNWANNAATRFIGDVFAYLDNRGDANDPGPIPTRLLAELQTAKERRTPDDPLIVVGHSMGGIILYDLFTSYVPHLMSDLQVDHYVTVGSQVGFMQEMDHFPANKGVTGVEIGRPACVDNWINVFDKTDPLSYLVEPVFGDDGIADMVFSSVTGLLSAHTAYFVRASFYKRLGKRLRGQ